MKHITPLITSFLQFVDAVSDNLIVIEFASFLCASLNSIQGKILLQEITDVTDNRPDFGLRTTDQFLLLNFVEISIQLFLTTWKPAFQHLGVN